MKIKDILNDIQIHLTNTPAIGHTHAVIHGARATNNVTVLVASHNHGKSIKKLAPDCNTMIIGREKLADDDAKSRIMIDNAALRILCGMAAAEIERLEDLISSENT